MIHIANASARVPAKKIYAFHLLRYFASVLAGAMLVTASVQAQSPSFDSFAVPSGSAPHDVAPDPGGAVWYTAQAQGAVGRLDPRSGKTERIALGNGSAPHGVIVGPDGAVLAAAGNRTEEDRDPTAHAEMLAIRAAAAH